MSTVAILGAGQLGAAIAHKLAERDRFREIRLIDAQSDVAAGKALDIQQSAPISGFRTRVRADRDALSAAGASVVVIADSVAEGEWDVTRGTPLVEQLVRGGTTGPFVFAGAGQLPLMETLVRAGKVKANRALATGPSAMTGAAAGLVSLEWNGSASEIDVIVAGRPPRLVVGWSSANSGGVLIESRVPAHRLLALSQTLARVWPPAPQAIAAATAPIVEALVLGSRRLHQAAVMLDGEFGVRDAAGMIPVELGHGRIRQRVMPSLSPVEIAAAQKSLMSQ
jgi:malate dehydrogenase